MQWSIDPLVPVFLKVKSNVEISSVLVIAFQLISIDKNIKFSNWQIN